MAFQVGDKVIHITHGLGEISSIEKRLINDQSTDCYVVTTDELTVWIPIDEVQQHSLRTPTLPEEFERSFAILTSPCEALPEDRTQRKNQLMARLQEGQLAGICSVVRDLTHYMRIARSNNQEKFILERATRSLQTEWSYSHQVPMYQAQLAVDKLLHGEGARSPLPLIR